MKIPCFSQHDANHNVRMKHLQMEGFNFSLAKFDSLQFLSKWKPMVLVFSSACPLCNKSSLLPLLLFIRINKFELITCQSYSINGKFALNYYLSAFVCIIRHNGDIE